MIEINERGTKPKITEHLTLSVKNYTTIKAQKRPKVSLEGESMDELTKLEEGSRITMVH